MAELTVPKLDFSSLGDLPQTYRAGQMDATRRATLAQLGQGASASDVATALFKAGDIQGGLSLANLANAQSDRTFRQSESERQQRNFETTNQRQEAQLNKPSYQIVEDGNGGKRLIKIDPMKGDTADVTPTSLSQPQTGGEPVPPGVNPGEYRKALARKQADIAANEPEAQSSVNDAVANLQRLKAAALEIKNGGGVSRITGMQGVFPSIPGGKAADTEAKLETLKSQIGFSVLQAMRNASKTGGALGAISDKENVMLQNNLAALSTKQSPKQFLQSLQDIIEYADASAGRIRGAYDATYKKSAQPQQASNKPTKVSGREEYDALPSGASYIAPDGSLRTKR